MTTFMAVYILTKRKGSTLERLNSGLTARPFYGKTAYLKKVHFEKNSFKVHLAAFFTELEI